MPIQALFSGLAGQVTLESSRSMEKRRHLLCQAKAWEHDDDAQREVKKLYLAITLVVIL